MIEMIPDKYRGKNVLTDEYVYGKETVPCLNYFRIGKYLVKPESLQKLAGYDKEGNEIYKRAGWTK